MCEGLYSASIGVTPWASGATKIWASMYLSVIHLVVYLLYLVTTRLGITVIGCVSEYPIIHWVENNDSKLLYCTFVSECCVLCRRLWFTVEALYELVRSCITIIRDSISPNITFLLDITGIFS